MAEQIQASADINEVGLDRLDLSTRTANCCHNMGITTLGGLADLYSVDIISWRSAGLKTLTEIREILGSVGLKLRDDLTPTGKINLARVRELQLIVPEAALQPSDTPVFLLESATEDQQKILGIPIKKLPLSVRARNIIAQLNAKHIVDIAKLSTRDILKVPNSGVKTLAELREILGGVGLKLRDDPAPVGKINLALLNELQLPLQPLQIPLFLLESATEDQQKNLVIPIQKVPLSVRARNIIAGFNAKHLGDIAQLSTGDILGARSSGLTTLAELESLMESHGLQLGMPIADWSDEQVAATTKRLRSAIAVSAKERSNRLLAAIDPSPRTLEAELGRIVRSFESERNSDALLKLWGWSDSDPRVLDSVGQEYGLTRERVRQIEARAIKRFSAHQFDLPLVRRAIESVAKCVPMRDSTISERLRASALSEKAFSVWGLKKAAEIFNIRWPFEVMSLKGTRMLTVREEGLPFRRALIELRKKTSDRGLTNIAALAAEAGLEEDRSSALRLFLETAADVAWLDDAKEWLFLPDVPRNRLANLCSKVLSVSPEIRIAELRRAVSKSRRLAMVPPQRILATFVERQKLATVTNDIARVIPGAVKSLAADSLEANMLTVLGEHGPIMDGEQFARRCVEAGINATSFYLYRLNSPVISSLGKGVYCKVGADVAPGAVEDIVARRNAMPRVSDHGWTSKGRLWFGLELSVGAIQGSIRLASFVSDFVQGEWEVVLPDQSTCGTVICKGVFIHSFRRAFGLLGAEHTDFAAFEFDLNERRMHVRVGGPGLVEQIEDPESIQAEMANDDDNEATSGD